MGGQVSAGAGLAYDQAPSLGLPLAYFLTAPAFLFLAALAGLATLPDWLDSRWSPAALALTHLLTLGFLGMVMVGALLQMLPVLLGRPVPAVRGVARAGWLGLGLGTPLLGLGLGRGEPVLLLAAMIVLLAGLAPILIGAAWVLARARGQSWVAWPMRQAWLALLITLGLGGLLAGGLAGRWAVGDPASLTDLHAAWGLGGWVLILVIGVAYQVVPMLQLTPAYPTWLSRWLTWWLLAGLAAYSLAQVQDDDAFAPAAMAGVVMVALAALAFALATLRVQQRRRRKLADVTLDFWRLGMASLIFCALALPLLERLPEPARISIGIVFLLGFVASVAKGMLYKIVPFLAWFHLQAQTGARAGTIPNMKEMITDRFARRNFRMHLAAVLLLAPAPFLAAPLAVPGLLCLAAAALLLGRNLFSARRLFLAHGGRL
ncbi:MAG: hypothetical protein MUC79_12400 [Thiobacillaceae bacterium]|nr:hypothetical protein [Thiobacillaceae bacterium]